MTQYQERYIYEIADHRGYFYIGQRSRSPINDSYMGSGKHLRNAMKLFGKESFTKTIICSGWFTKKQIDSLERAFIGIYREIKNAHYNHSDGGTGGDLGEESRRKIGLANLMRPMKDSTREKLVEIGRRINNLGNFARGKHWYTNGTYAVLSSECPPGFQLGRSIKPPKEARPRVPWNKGLKASPETRRKLSESHRGIKYSEESSRRKSESIKRAWRLKKAALELTTHG
jgi:hypothetical protein